MTQHKIAYQLVGRPLSQCYSLSPPHQSDLDESGGDWYAVRDAGRLTRKMKQVKPHVNLHE